MKQVAGIGLRAPHLAEVAAGRDEHEPERAHHAVGLSLGSAEGLDEAHLARVAALVKRLEPAWVSDHLSWSVSGGRYFNDLLPLPYTEEALDVVVRNVGRLQDVLGRQVSIENPSCYLGFTDSSLSEPAFLAELVRRSGCGLLLDANNIVVTAHNLRLDPHDWLAGLPREAITQYHLAGHAVNNADGEPILIDDHGSRVSDGVWALFAQVVKRFGARPTLIDWYTEIPPVGVRLAAAARAAGVLETVPQAGGNDAARAA